jgi:hypothetical protein
MSNTHNDNLFRTRLENHAEVSNAKPEAPIPLPRERLDVALT